ncbi:MAG: hypothetical protein O7G88_10535 [bacterium]|nr:hypothetical protein [bacterium]
MFFLNLQTCKQQPFIRQHYAAETLADMERALQALIEASPDDTEIEWGMRQLAYERV